MRKWLVEETENVRCPGEYENFLFDGKIFMAYPNHNYPDYPILKVTELTDDPTPTGWDEW